MARVTCRCGEVLKVAAGDERVVCPRCGARIRVRHRAVEARPEAPPSDGFVRFGCPCGRRLKVRAVDGPKAGRCPDCGRTVPVPDAARAAALQDPETRTEEMDRNDIARLQRWAARHGVSSGRPAAVAAPAQPSAAEPYAPPRAARVEAGLRLCPKCGQPLHMSAVACPSCGAYAPKT